MYRNALKCLLSSALLFASVALVAQDQEPSKVDLFTGYSYANPRTRIAGIDTGDQPRGFDVSGTYFFNKWAGLTLDGGGNFGEKADSGTLQIGPTLRFPTSNGVTPFIHGLIGLHEMAISTLPSNAGIGITGGGGLDFHTKWPRVNIRLIQADVQYAHHNPSLGTRFDMVGARLSSGLVWRFGTFGPPAAPPTAACKAEPSEVFEGEPVTVSATTQGFNPKHTLAYNWTGAQGVNVKGTNETAQVDTKGLQPGSYPVKVTVADKKITAECTANVVIKQPRPPQITCSANPTTVKPGETATISCQGSSPDNRQLKYSHQASAGQLTPSDANATLNTQGAEPGSSITVNSTVTDDRNLSANTSTSVSVEAPPAPAPAPTPESQKVNTLNFKKNSARVDNAAKAILDDVALRLQRDADAKAVIVGDVDQGENKRIAGQRAANAKAYLVKEKGIDASRVEVRTGSTAGTTADIWIVPAGATFNEEGTQAVTETAAARKKPAAKKKQ
jgi:outer membrane protein OmpA-like peptidoglycan-associated protein